MRQTRGVRVARRMGRGNHAQTPPPAPGHEMINPSGRASPGNYSAWERVRATLVTVTSNAIDFARGNSSEDAAGVPSPHEGSPDITIKAECPNEKVEMYRWHRVQARSRPSITEIPTLSFTERKIYRPQLEELSHRHGNHEAHPSDPRHQRDNPGSFDRHVCVPYMVEKQSVWLVCWVCSADMWSVAEPHHEGTQRRMGCHSKASAIPSHLCSDNK
jgi:hypothetical protein